MLGPAPGDLLCPLLLTKLVSPLPIRLLSPCPTGLCFPYSLPLRLRAPRLLRPSCESPLMPWGREASLYFRCLELCPCFYLIKPSSRRHVAVALLLCHCHLGRAHHAY